MKGGLAQKIAELRFHELWMHPWPYLLDMGRRLVYYPFLRRMIQGRRVLILGSGPSCGDLKTIPDDVLVFTCNAGPRFLAQRAFSRKIDFYFCSSVKFVRKEVEVWLPRVGAAVFMTDDPAQVRRNPALRRSYERLLAYERMHKNFATRWSRLHDLAHLRTPSTGLRLVQYAFYFDAAEIYVIGIDLEESGYVGGGKNKQKHAVVDSDFIRAMAHDHGRIYSMAESSPLSRLIPAKDFF